MKVWGSQTLTMKHNAGKLWKVFADRSHDQHWCICRLKVHEKPCIFTTTDLTRSYSIQFYSVFYSAGLWRAQWTNNHATSALHMYSCFVSFTVRMRRLMYKKHHLQGKQTFHGLSCRNNELVHNSSVYFAWDDGHSPMRLKLSDKVLLNFFILPIFSAGWAAGIKSHMSLKWDA